MDETELLATTLERLLDDHDGGQPPDGFDDVLWRELDAGGFTRIGVPQPAGGSGGTIRDAHVVVDRLAWAAASVPVPETILAGWLCSRAGVVLPAGPVTVGLAGPRDGIRMKCTGTTWRVSGRVDRVPWAGVCGHLVVIAARRAGSAVAVVPTSAARISAGRNLAGEHRDAVELERVVIDRSRVGIAEDLTPELALGAGAMLRAVQVAATLRRTVALTRSHVADRVQFGQRLSSFQHVRFRLAEMVEETVAASTAAEAAMVMTDARPSLLEAASAKVRAARAVRVVAATAHQLHGAIGFTDEHPLHRFTTRAWSWRDELGTEGWWQEQLGAAVIGAGSGALWPTIAGE
jgi:acyl-CoA dehydrogenase